MTAGGREFQVAGAAQLKDRLPISVHLKAKRHARKLLLTPRKFISLL